MRIENLAGLVGREEGVDVALLGHVDALDGMGEDEAVHAHHDREGELLGEAEGLNVQVRRLLIRLGEELDPAGVAHRHGVAVVVPDVDRRTDCPVCQCHHDRQTETRCVVDRFDHEQEPLARGRGVGARARGGGADRDRHRRELRLDIDELARRELARLHHGADRLDDVGLRRDRIGTHDLGPTQGHRLCHGARAFNLSTARVSSPSSSVTKRKAALAAATLRSPGVPENRSRIAESIASRVISPGEGGKAAEQCGVRQRPAEMLEGKLCRRAGEQAVAVELLEELAEPELVEAAARCSRARIPPGRVRRTGRPGGSA